MRRRAWALTWVAAWLAGASVAEPAQQAALQQRAAQVAGWVQPPPADMTDALAPGFMQAVTPSALASLLGTLHAQLGPCPRVSRLDDGPDSAMSGRFIELSLNDDITRAQPEPSMRR